MVSEHASPLATLGGVDAGGQNVHVAALSCALARAGHEVTVYTRRDDPALPTRVAMAPGLKVRHLDAGPPIPLPKDDLLPYVAKMAECLRKSWLLEPPDVVHAHFWMSGLAALHAGRPLGVPVVQTFHALGAVKRRHQGPKDTSPPERIAHETAIIEVASRIIATCADELDELVRLGADATKVSVVPCGVDTTLFAPSRAVGAEAAVGSLGAFQDRTFRSLAFKCRSPGERPMPYRLGTVGRLVERKGIDDIIKALVDIPDAELVVAGGPHADGLPWDADARRLLDLARDLGVARRVTLIGRLGREQVPRLLRSIDLAICVPWYEPFGIAPLEAMSCAVPVVAAAVGGLSDTVVDGVTGLHVPPRNPARLAKAVRLLLADPARRSTMGAAGRARVVEQYQWSSVACRTLEAYEIALDASGPVRRTALI